MPRCARHGVGPRLPRTAHTRFEIIINTLSDTSGHKIVGLQLTATLAHVHMVGTWSPNFWQSAITHSACGIARGAPAAQPAAAMSSGRGEDAGGAQRAASAALTSVRTRCVVPRVAVTVIVLFQLWRGKGRASH